MINKKIQLVFLTFITLLNLSSLSAFDKGYPSTRRTRTPDFWIQETLAEKGIIFSVNLSAYNFLLANTPGNLIPQKRGFLKFRESQEKGHLKEVSRRLLVLEYILDKEEWISLRCPVGRREPHQKLEEALYLSLWVYASGRGESLYIDLGEISEDSDGNGVLDFEDRNKNGILDRGEDVGLDGVSGAAPGGEGWIKGWNDDYDLQKNPTGTEGNNRLDTEDMDHNQKLNFLKEKERYLQYKVKLKKKGWQLINLELNAPYGKVGEISLGEIKHLRLWLANETDKKIGGEGKDEPTAKLKIEEINFCREKQREKMPKKLIPDVEIQQIKAKLSVRGEDIIDLKYSFRHPSHGEGKAPIFPAGFKMENLLSLAIAGTIGDKISLNISHRQTQRGEIREEKTDIKIDYTGKRREALKTIQFGDISLAPLKLPPGMPTNEVFGVLAEVEFDDERINRFFNKIRKKKKKRKKEEEKTSPLFRKNFKIVGALSQATNQFSVEEFRGGYEERKLQIRDTSYIARRYYSFWYSKVYPERNAEEIYQEAYKIRNPDYVGGKIKRINGRRSYEIVPNSEVIFIDKKRYGLEGGVEVKDKGIVEDVPCWLEQQYPGLSNDYIIDYQTGTITFNQSINPSWLIYVAYQYYDEKGEKRSVGYVLEDGKIKYSSGIELKTEAEIKKYFKGLKCIKYQDETLSRVGVKYGNTEQKRFYNLFTGLGGGRIIPFEEDPEKFKFEVVRKDNPDSKLYPYSNIHEAQGAIKIDYENNILCFYEPLSPTNFTEKDFQSRHQYIIRMEFKVRKLTFSLRYGRQLVKGSERVYLDGILQDKSAYYFDDAGNLHFYDQSRIAKDTTIRVEYEWKPFLGLGAVNNLAGMRGEVNLTSSEFWLKRMSLGSTFFLQNTPDISLGARGKKVPPNLGAEPSTRLLKTLDGEIGFNFVLKGREKKAELEVPPKEPFQTLEKDLEKKTNEEEEKEGQKQGEEIKEEGKEGPRGEIEEEGKGFYRSRREENDWDEESKEKSQSPSSRETEFPINITLSGKVGYLDSDLNTYRYEGDAEVSPQIQGKPVAMIENMEGIDISVRVGMDYSAWLPSSPPADPTRHLTQQNRGVTKIRKELGYGKDSVDRRQLFSFQYELEPGQWSGIRTAIIKSDAGRNMEEYRKLEISLSSSGSEHQEIEFFIDVGEINEDSDGDGKIDLEDFNNNRQLDTRPEREDIGLSGKKPEKFGGDGWVKGWEDEWSEENLAGTKGNGYLDTEDLDGDGYLDYQEIFFRFKIPPDSLNWDEERCRAISINLAEGETIGLPSWKRIKHIRVWVRNKSRQKISGKFNIESIRFVGNKWKINPAWEKMVLERKKEKKPFLPIPFFEVDFVNTRDHPFYQEDPEFKPDRPQESFSPFESQEEIKEQALRIRYRNILPQKDWASQAWVNLSLGRHSGNFTWYKKLRFSVFSRYRPEENFFFRFGSGTETNQIQYKVPLRTIGKWIKVEVDLEEAREVLQEYYRKYPYTPPTENHGVYTTSDGRWAIKGRPVLNNITEFFFGIEESFHSYENEIWINNLVVYDVERKKGKQQSIGLNTSFSNWLRTEVTHTQTEANFSSAQLSSSPGSTSGGIYTKTSSNITLSSPGFTFFPELRSEKREELLDKKTMTKYSAETLYKKHFQKETLIWRRFSFNLIDKERIKEGRKNFLNLIDGVKFIDQLQIHPELSVSQEKTENDYFINNFPEESMDEKTTLLSYNPATNFNFRLEKNKFIPVLNHNFEVSYGYTRTDTDYNPEYLELRREKKTSLPSLDQEPVEIKTYRYSWSGSQSPYEGFLTFSPSLAYSYTLKKNQNPHKKRIAGRLEEVEGDKVFSKQSERKEGNLNVKLNPPLILKEISTTFGASLDHSLERERYLFDNTFDFSFQLNFKDIFGLWSKKKKEMEEALQEQERQMSQGIYESLPEKQRKESYFTFEGIRPQFQLYSKHEYNYTNFWNKFKPFPLSEILKIKLREEEEIGMSLSSRKRELILSLDGLSWYLWAYDLNKKDFFEKKEKTGEYKHSCFSFSPTLTLANTLSRRNFWLEDTSIYSFSFGIRNSHPFIFEKGIFRICDFEEFCLFYQGSLTLNKTFTAEKKQINENKRISHQFSLTTAFKKSSLKYDKKKEKCTFIPGKSFYRLTFFDSNFNREEGRDYKSKRLEVSFLQLTLNVNNVNFTSAFKIWKKEFQINQTFDLRYEAELCKYTEEVKEIPYLSQKQSMDWIITKIGLTYSFLENIRATFGLSAQWHDDLAFQMKDQGTRDFVELAISVIIRIGLE